MLRKVVKLLWNGGGEGVNVIWQYKLCIGFSETHEIFRDTIIDG